MKKFFVCLLLVAAFAGFVFYLGWVQIKVKPDNVGVIISKTKGIDSEPVIPGEFRWAKEFLLPTNAQLKLFKINPVNCTRNVNGQLPSGELYTSVYNSGNSFRYDFDYTISLTVSPYAIIDLLEQNKITDQKDFEEYLNGAADTVAQLVTNYILDKQKENPAFRPESIRRDDLFRAVQIYKDFPEIELSVFAITKSIIPDFKLYSQLQNQFVQNQDKYFLASSQNEKSNSSDYESNQSEERDFLENSTESINNIY